jgi:predicted nucleic acid-binding protein
VSIYGDTSAFVTVLDAADPNHEAAKLIWQDLVEGETPIVSSNYVIAETSAVVQRQLGMGAARAFHEGICPWLDVAWVDEGLHRAGVEAMLGAGRRRLSLVDCVSFELMRRYGIGRAFCFDPHFQEAGFESVAAAQ